MTDRFKKKRKEEVVQFEAEHHPDMRGVIEVEDGKWFTPYGHTMAPPQNGGFVTAHYHQAMLMTLNEEVAALRMWLKECERERDVISPKPFQNSRGKL